MILDYNLDDVPELKAVPAGEYKLTIISAEEKFDKNGNPGLRVAFKIDAEEAKIVTTWISLPGENDDEETKNNKLRRFKRFVQCFGIELPVEVEELAGAEGWVILDVEESEEYGEQNRIKRYLVQN